MEFLKLNIDTFKLTPLLSNIDDEITIELQIESSHLHNVKLNANIKVNKTNIKIIHKIKSLACYRFRLQKNRNIIARRKLHFA